MTCQAFRTPWKFNDFRVITRPGDDSRGNAAEQRVR